MKSKKHLILSIVIGASGLTTLSGCGLFKKSSEQKTSIPIQQDKQIAEFERGNKLLDANQYEEAALIFDRIVTDNPSSNLDLLIVYNSGIAHLMSLNCEVASERFRKVIRISAKSAPAVRGRALLRMSDVYTCLGDDRKAITTLIEVMKGQFSLPVEIMKAEVPSKLATAYARIGNLKEAEKYFRIAEKGLSQVEVRYRNPQERMQAMGMTLYLMGNISQINVQTMSSEEYFATVKSLQRYLFRAVELNAAPWANQAADQIEQIYKNTWFYIERGDAPLSDDEKSTVPERDSRVAKVKVARSALSTLQALFAERIPDPQESPRMKQLLQYAKKEELKIRNYLATNTLGAELTQEAKEAAAIKRPGRVANPDPVLEKQSLKNKKTQ